MDFLIRASVSLFPVFFFLMILIFLDSFKLVKLRSIILTLSIGTVAAVVSFFINNMIMDLLAIRYPEYSRYCSPIVEEVMKALYFYYLMKTGRIGFLVDAAIYGFALGAGFAFMENLYWLHSVTNSNLFMWIIRGVGTAIMHGGTTAVFGMIAKNISDRRSSNRVTVFLPALCPAIIIHSFFNHFFFSPTVTTVGQLILLPILILFVFSKSESSLREWLEIGLDTDVYVLEMITSGNISQSKIGQYLDSIQHRFPGEVVVDMLCLLRTHLELTIRAKGALMMREAGFKTPVDSEIVSRFDELKYLEKSIGKTGKLTISPFLQTSSLDLWQLHFLRKK
jgi:RsiW-degrading membrane proteinase PrsW (M82 family)